MILFVVFSILYACRCGNAYVSSSRPTIKSTTATYRNVQPPPSRGDVFLQMSGKGFGAKATFKYAGDLRPGKASKALPVPKDIARPDYAVDGIPKLGRQKGDRLSVNIIILMVTCHFGCLVLGMPWDVTPQTKEDIERMRVAGRIAREVLDTAIRFSVYHIVLTIKFSELYLMPLTYKLWSIHDIM